MGSYQAKEADPEFEERSEFPPPPDTRKPITFMCYDEKPKKRFCEEGHQLTQYYFQPHTEGERIIKTKLMAFGEHDFRCDSCDRHWRPWKQSSGFWHCDFCGDYDICHACADGSVGSGVDDDIFSQDFAASAAAAATTTTMDPLHPVSVMCGSRSISKPKETNTLNKTKSPYSTLQLDSVSASNLYDKLGKTNARKDAQDDAPPIFPYLVEHSDAVNPKKKNNQSDRAKSREQEEREKQEEEMKKAWLARMKAEEEAEARRKRDLAEYQAETGLVDDEETWFKEEDRSARILRKHRENLRRQKEKKERQEKIAKRRSKRG